MDKTDALVSNEITTWAELSRQAGDILPSNPAILENMFLLQQMRCKYITIAKRVEIREDLLKRGVLRDKEPITALEKLAAINARNFAIAPVVDMVKGKGFKEVVLVFMEDRIRRRGYMKVAEQLRSQLDMARCSIPKMELYTADGVRVKFITPDDYYEPPDTPIAYRIVNYDI
jgi:hypothetical protein